MGFRATYIALLITEVTSIPLLTVAAIMILSGYGIMNPQIISNMLGIGYTEALKIHLDTVLRTSFIALTLLHSYAGLTILIERRMRRKEIAIIAYGIATAITLLIVGIAIIAETLR